MLVKDKPKLQANRYVITARWLYLIAIFLVGWLMRFGEPTSRFENPLPTLVGVIGTALLLNLLLLAYSSYIDRHGSSSSVKLLGVLQITIDIILLSVLMYVVGGVNTIIPVLFFIPIVESILLFDAWGPVVVALFSGLITTVWVFLDDYSIKTPEMNGLQISAWRAFSVSLIYLMIGIFSAYISRLIKERSDLLAKEAAFKEAELQAVQNLNKQLEAQTKQLEAKDTELTLANHRLEALESAKSKFVSITTHQLRTPLAAIKWTFSMLLEGQLGKISDEQKEFVRKGFQSAERMISIVNELLTIDLIEADKPDYHFGSYRLEELIDNVMFEFANQAQSKQLKLEFKRTLKPVPEMEFDQGKIRMVLENFIDNAIKYTPKHGSVTITIDDAGITTPSNTIKISFADTGIGIPESDRSKIFNKFYRTPGAVSVEPDGSGLGLFIAKDIIEHHGGTVWFDSTPGKGTTFHLTLPVHQKKV